MPARRKTTIYELSALSGTSPSTVSAVLNGSWRKRRISEETANAILTLASDLDYRVNRQAQGLRTSTSGLVALLLPIYDNRFFSNLAQTFEALVRASGRTPLVSSTGRDPDLEQATMRSLIAYGLDAVFICGATDPDGLDRICHDAWLPHVNIDLPGSKSHSVVSDNYAGARALTEAILTEASGRGVVLAADELCFFGGRNDANTHARQRGFLEARAALGEIGNRGCYVSGYSPEMTRCDLEAVIAGRGRLPYALFFNSTINFEGLLAVLAAHPPTLSNGLIVGCVDYDPFGSFLPFSVFMLEQDVEAMLSKAFELLSRWQEPAELHLIPPRLVPPRSAIAGPINQLKQII